MLCIFLWQFGHNATTLLSISGPFLDNQIGIPQFVHCFENSENSLPHSEQVISAIWAPRGLLWSERGEREEGGHAVPIYQHVFLRYALFHL